MSERVTSALITLLGAALVAASTANPGVTRESRASVPALFFSLGGVYPCETQTLPAKGKEEACRAEDQSCVDAFGSDFTCEYQGNEHCSCIVSEPEPL